MASETLVKPVASLRCLSKESKQSPMDLSLDIYNTLEHPMGGAYNLFGIIHLKWRPVGGIGEIQYPFKVIPNDGGLIFEGLTQGETQYRLVMPRIAEKAPVAASFEVVTTIETGESYRDLVVSLECKNPNHPTPKK